MRILLLCEGDAESSGGSWSGSSKSLLTCFRAEGHVVTTADTDLYREDRWLQAIWAFSPNRLRWGVKYHLGGSGFRARTRKARQAIQKAPGSIDAILQIGATFEPAGRGRTPYYLYCDSNILLARHGRGTGQSDASFLTPGQLSKVAARERAVYQGASGIFTLSERLRMSFIEDFDLRPERVHTAPPGPNFDPAELPLKRWGDEGAPTILFVGAKFARKGGDVLVRAFKGVRRQIPEARLILIGPRDLHIDEPGVVNLGYLRKDDPGEKSRLAEAFAEADVFCLPTRFEPFGVAFLEAMYCGLPCIGTNVWAVPEMIEDGVTGYTCPPDDAAALEARLVQLLNDRALAQRMGNAGRRKAATHFTWPHAVSKMVRVMESGSAYPSSS